MRRIGCVWGEEGGLGYVGSVASSLENERTLAGTTASYAVLAIVWSRCLKESSTMDEEKEKEKEGKEVGGREVPEVKA